MVTCAIQVMDSTGHTTLTWTPGDEEEEAKARKVVETMRGAGYTFFLVSGQPADEVTAGAGQLIVRALGEDPIGDLSTEAELRTAAKAGVLTDEGEVPAETSVDRAVERQQRRRGRPPRQEPPAAEAVAVRRMAGG